MAEKLQIRSESSELLRDQLLCLQRNLSVVETGAGPLDFRHFDWAWPLTTVPLAAVIYEQGREVTNCTNTYLQTIGFPNGFDSVQDLRKNRTYIPLVRIPTSSAEIIEQLNSHFSNLVFSYIDFAGNFRNAWSYTVGEMLDNISQHSQSSSGWLLAQYWPTREFLDLVILDRGLGFRKVYEKAYQERYTDREALKAALKGRSVKKDKERGYGIRTTKNLITGAELSGKFLMISGNSAYYADSDRELWLDLGGWQWKGAIIVCRVKRATKPVDIYRYVEG